MLLHGFYSRHEWISLYDTMRSSLSCPRQILYTIQHTIIGQLNTGMINLFTEFLSNIYNFFSNILVDE